jgi:hypothetical protein
MEALKMRVPHHRWTVTLAVVAANLLAMLIVAPAASASTVAPNEAGSYYLAPTQSLGVGQYIRRNGYGLILQYDGNLVFYRHFQGSGGTQSACWATNTTHNPGPYNRRLVMQQDGNLVLYLYSGGPVQWASNTADPKHFGDYVWVDGSQLVLNDSPAHSPIDTFLASC